MKEAGPTVVFVSSQGSGLVDLNINNTLLKLTKEQCFNIALDLLGEVRRWPDPAPKMSRSNKCDDFPADIP